MSVGAQDPEIEVLVAEIQRYKDLAQRMVDAVGPWPRIIEAVVANGWPTLGPAFVFRATNILEAIVALPMWHLTGAAILVRSLYEHVTTFAWLATDPRTNLTAWDLEDLRQGIAAHDDTVRLGFGPLLTAEQLAVYKRELGREGHPGKGKGKGAPMEKKKIPFPNVAEQARVADAHWGKLEESFRIPRYALCGMYPVVYRQFSAMVHGSGPSIRGLVSPGPTRGKWYVGAEMGTGYSNAFTIAPSIFAMCLLASGHALGFPDRNAVLRCMRDDQGIGVE